MSASCLALTGLGAHPAAFRSPLPHGGRAHFCVGAYSGLGVRGKKGKSQVSQLSDAMGLAVS